MGQILSLTVFPKKEVFAYLEKFVKSIRVKFTLRTPSISELVVPLLYTFLSQFVHSNGVTTIISVLRDTEKLIDWLLLPIKNST